MISHFLAFVNSFLSKNNNYFLIFFLCSFHENISGNPVRCNAGRISRKILYINIYINIYTGNINIFWKKMRYTYKRREKERKKC